MEISDLIEGKSIVLDTSFLHVGRDRIIHKLYENRWDLVSEDELTRHIQHFMLINDVFSNPNVYVPLEVVAEYKRFVELLNTHSRYFGSPNRKPDKDLRKKERGSWAIKREDTYSMFRELTNSAYGLLRKLNSCCFKPNFSGEEGSRYQILLDIARFRSGDIRKKSHFLYKNFENHEFLGDKLETDQKIAAIGFALAYKNPIIILSRDRDIPKLCGRILEHIGEESKERTKILEDPKNSLSIYGIADYNSETNEYYTKTIKVIRESSSLSFA